MMTVVSNIPSRVDGGGCDQNTEKLRFSALSNEFLTVVKLWNLDVGHIHATSAGPAYLAIVVPW